MIELICYKKCSTCRDVEKKLKDLKVEYTYREIDKEIPNQEELKEWHKKSGLPLKRFFNTSGKVYREMKLKDKLQDMSHEDQYLLLSKDGMLIKRPILLYEDQIYIGPDVKKYIESMK
ncbi:MAG: Spx/MgsR family RNA polymerase-binding regulatory protein [Tissierellia bacterium]|nr:Spx/MgsR family RNA polymerase-binding regulatory protein [Tissierellia bacterium]